MGIRLRMALASGALALVVAGVFAGLLDAVSELRDANERARHSADVIAAASRVERAVVDVQNGERGFIITGDERFLADWDRGRSALPRELEALSRAVAEDAHHLELAADLGRATRSYVTEYSLPLVEAAQEDPAAARTVVRTGEGRRRIGSVRAQLDALNDDEAADLAQSRAASSSATDRAILLGAGGLAVSVLLVLLFAAYLARAIVVPVTRVSKSAGRLAGGDLSSRVPEGGAGEIGELGRAFNAMAASLEESRSELESQNVELELQAAELEEQKLELEGQRLELDRYFTFSLEMLGIAGLDGYFRRLNPAFERTLGYTQEELLAEPFVNFVHPDDREATLAEVEKLARGIDTVSFENRYRGKDGSYRWILWSSTAFPESGLIYAAARDVTERKEAEERLRSLNEDLAAVNVELEAQQVELETQQADLERALDELAAEKERIEALYRFAARLAPESELEPFARLALEQIAGFAGAEVGTLYTADGDGAFRLAAVLGADARALPAELEPGVGLAGRALAERRTLSVSHGDTGLRLPVFGEDVAVRHELHVPLAVGEDALGLLTLARLTDRSFSAEDLEALEHLADQAAVLLANRLTLAQVTRLAALNRAMLGAITDGIRLVGPDGRTLLANPEIERITTEVFGLPADSTLAERSADIAGRLTDPEPYLASEAAIAASPEAETVDEFQLAGSGRWFRRYTVPVRGPGGEVIGRVIVVRETTTEREAEELKTQLVATVSHELRTPLTGIMGFSELLARHEVDEAERARYAEIIHTEAVRLSSLVNDFLDLQRIEAGGFTLALEDVDLRELVHHEVELHAGESAAHAVEHVLPAEPLVVRGESDRIAQVLANLLSNAIKYSPGGGRVEVRAETHAGSVRVSVRDEGLGIPKAQQAHIFSKFFRVDSTDTRTIGGTGLGLAISREIVEAHGGSIGFESTEGEGSTFWFELPLSGPGSSTAAAG